MLDIDGYLSAAGLIGDHVEQPRALARLLGVLAQRLDGHPQNACSAPASDDVGSLADAAGTRGQIRGTHWSTVAPPGHAWPENAGL
jgi:hypothetical protein